MSAQGEDTAAIDALSAVAEVFASRAGVLFEQGIGASGPYRKTAQQGTAPEPIEFASSSLLPRWLRVNKQVLALPDTIGLSEALPPQEQAWLGRLGLGLAVPLLIDDDLVAWAILTGLFSPTNTVQLPVAVRQAASRLKSAREEESRRARTDGVMRSNRLSVAGQMAAGIAHEVRNPLAAVRSIVQLVRAEAVPKSEQPRLLDNVIAEVDRVNGVLSGMMGLGRSAQHRDETVDLAEIAGAAAGFFRAYATYRGITIECALSPGLWVQGDAYELRQVFINLLLNACQASKPGQRIHINGTAQQDHPGGPKTSVRVSDTGEGMAAAVMARVFEPFFTTKKDGGGLGLSICREAVERHGGRISISSEAGAGTTVAIELPLVSHHAAHSGRR